LCDSDGSTAVLQHGRDSDQWQKHSKANYSLLGSGFPRLTCVSSSHIALDFTQLLEEHYASYHSNNYSEENREPSECGSHDIDAQLGVYG